MFIFAVYGIQIVGGQLARCNDRVYYNEQVDTYEYMCGFRLIRSMNMQRLCHGTFWRELYVSKMNVTGADPLMLVPRVW
jgi:hypothetical protein